MLLLYMLFLNLFEVEADHLCHPRCEMHSYCCGEDICCKRHGYSFYSMWYFWFIIAMLILSCATSCSYYRRRRRMLAMRRRLNSGVVVFSSGNREHAPNQQVMPPSYQEVTDKSLGHPPPYYSIDPYASQSTHAFVQVLPAANPPPYPGNNPQETESQQQTQQQGHR